MCGLVGELGPSIEGLESAEAITRTLFHRGPDEGGHASGDGWWLGFRRLSILDLTSTGHQPMSAEDGRYWLAFNGEIYNYRELASDLVSRGVKLRGSSDTEVLLNLLVRCGADCLGLLNGMFAFVFIDLVERRFLIARDRLGVKPLYWTMQKGTLRFASELKALLAWPGAARSLNRQAIRNFLSLGYLPAGTPIFESYNQLPPGSFAEGSLDRPTLDPSPYWSVQIEPRPDPITDTDLEELQALLTDAVRIRLRSDVKLGIFLSGGIDSSLVAAIAGQLGGPLMALTVSRGDDGDESELATQTARKFGLDHRILPQRPATFDDVDELARAYDEPFGDTSALPMMLLCAAAAREATVFLSGDGGDEAFGGYGRYLKAARFGWLDFLPQALTRQVRLASGLLPLSSRLRYKLVKAGLRDGTMPAVLDGLGLLADPVLSLILPPDLKLMPGDIAVPVAELWSRSVASDVLSRQRDLDYKMYLPDDVLVKVDRASMAHSIEVRSPFLDYRIVEWAARLPQQDLMADGHGKVLLRRIAGGMLPEAVTRGPKRGFGVPVGDWFRKPEGKKLARERLLESDIHDQDLWDRAGAKELLGLHLAGGRDMGVYLWRLVVLESWARHYRAGDLCAPSARRTLTGPDADSHPVHTDFSSKHLK